ncbi:proton extrusion protein PcxA [Nostocaceae cyanobacterium CENA369]|uniref:Proton extrusion protein PxcA n=1 Tax=Dendronalium phyllosphericum CENA369 TaxID=1725256 RepID=A0A8J7LFQ4_9NOST|nr:proton extrusion protein PcxA [Dendronalium phyllosphericum]MBH8574054.1 proton extrusion protein PcxA [Dendronalium phyllosphericum CENA369]
MNQWFLNTPERALLEAYKAAQTIKNIEKEHFGSQKISAESVNYTENMMSYWQGCLEQNLLLIKLRLAEFQLSRSILNISNKTVLERLKFIDEVIDKYNFRDQLVNSNSVLEDAEINEDESHKKSDLSNLTKVQPISQKTGVLPRSIGITLNKIKSDFTPQAEAEFVRNYQLTRNRTKIALKFLLVLVIVPLLTQQLSKQILVSPIVERVRGNTITQIFLNSEMEEEALKELKNFEVQLRFESLIERSPSLSLKAKEVNLKQKAIEIAEEFRHKSSEAISNVFADILSLIAFAIVIANSKKEIAIVKSFIDDTVYGLSDSAKAFLIILFTDIFVGFHSPHGWEVILEGLAEHLGLSANRGVIYMFIATFPVILDTIFKYWIFRYLSRLSPSALATFKEMNE